VLASPNPRTFRCTDQPFRVRNTRPVSAIVCLGAGAARCSLILLCKTTCFILHVAQRTYTSISRAGVNAQSDSKHLLCSTASVLPFLCLITLCETDVTSRASDCAAPAPLVPASLRCRHTPAWHDIAPLLQQFETSIDSIMIMAPVPATSRSLNNGRPRASVRLFVFHNPTLDKTVRALSAGGASLRRAFVLRSSASQSTKLERHRHLAASAPIQGCS
jgi:hypothetical protein